MASLEQTTQMASSIQIVQGQLFTGVRVQERKIPAKCSLELEAQNVSLGSEWVLGPQVWVQVPLVSSSLEKNSQSPQVFRELDPGSVLWKDANSSLFGGTQWRL